MSGSWASRRPTIEPVSTSSPAEAVKALTGAIICPRAPERIAWPDVIDEIGTDLPADYRRLCEHFGPGVFAGDIVLLAPGDDPDVGLAPVAETIAEAQRAERDEGDFAFPIFPESAGALAWGRTVEGDHLCWITEGAPDSWKVVVVDPRDSILDPNGYHVYGGGTAQFLVDVLTAAIPEAEDWAPSVAEAGEPDLAAVGFEAD